MDLLGSFTNLSVHLTEFGSAEVILIPIISLLTIRTEFLFRLVPIPSSPFWASTTFSVLTAPSNSVAALLSAISRAKACFNLSSLAVLKSFNGALIVTEALVNKRLMPLSFRLLRLHLDRFVGLMIMKTAVHLHHLFGYVKGL